MPERQHDSSTVLAHTELAHTMLLGSSVRGEKDLFKKNLMVHLLDEEYDLGPNYSNVMLRSGSV